MSWIIQKNDTGEVFETQSKKNADVYKMIPTLTVYTIEEWLSRVNLYAMTDTVWKHRDGNNYRVITVSNTDSQKQEYPITVVYEDIRNGSVWSRPLSEWNRNFEKVVI